MSDKKMDSFRIGDTQRVSVAKPKRPAKPDRAAESQKHSLGFNRIEKILENDEAANVAEKLGNLLQALEQYEQQATAQKDKAAAKKAIVAVERTADLLDFLFQTKSSMQTNG